MPPSHANHDLGKPVLKPATAAGDHSLDHAQVLQRNLPSYRLWYLTGSLLKSWLTSTTQQLISSHCKISSRTQQISSHHTQFVHTFTRGPTSRRLTDSKFGRQHVHVNNVTGDCVSASW